MSGFMFSPCNSKLLLKTYVLNIKLLVSVFEGLIFPRNTRIALSIAYSMFHGQDIVYQTGQVSQP